MQQLRAYWRSLALGLALLASCQPPAAKYPWGDASKRPAEHAEVRTLNTGYQRTTGQVLVREVARPTRAALDYAAYHANFMIADPEPEAELALTRAPDTSRPFGELLEKDSLTSDIGKTPLTETERRQPLAFAPLSEFLQARKVEGAQGLAEVGAAVRAEKWGLQLPPGSPGQLLSELFVHEPPAGSPELWAKVEFQPWFKAFAGSADQDGDGFPELYGRVKKQLATPALIESIEKDYRDPLLSPAEIKAWANQLSSYWYPSFNTDLMPVAEQWPDEQTEADIKQELGSQLFEKPTVVLRGKPQGKPTYNVLIVRGETAQATTATPNEHPKLAKTRPTPEPRPVAEALQKELASAGQGSWAKWTKQLAPFHDALRRKVKAMPAKSKALAGNDGFLFYRNSLAYVAGGDLEKQRKGKNPLPVIIEFKRELARLGVDFLFVPVPTKLEIYPEKLDADFANLDGRIVTPSFRKLLLSLSKEGVEVVDLLPALLKAKANKASAGEQLLFQRQDTHWTDRGLRLAAELLSARIKKYLWFGQLAKNSQSFGIRETTFTRFGDLQSRLPEVEQAKYTPETLLAQQVLRPDKRPYEDDPDSPIVLLGDSFTGVYQLTDAEHAGVSAHIARGVSYPLDLVMSYGGGPNVRQKLLRRGTASLGSKKLVIWLMTARDLHDYWENWEPLKKP